MASPTVQKVGPEPHGPLEVYVYGLYSSGSIVSGDAGGPRCPTYNFSSCVYNY